MTAEGSNRADGVTKLAFIDRSIPRESAREQSLHCDLRQGHAVHLTNATVTGE